MATPTPLFAGIDAGGTTFGCLVADAAQKIVAEHRVPTTTPAQTFDECIAFLRSASAQKLSGIGIASFGPINIDPASDEYGIIGATPKPGWAGANLLTAFSEAFSCPVGIDTDVNGALLAESQWGSAKGTSRAAYITVGTGIGGGLMDDGNLIGRPYHPEIGHIRVHRYAEDAGDLASAAGACPFHGDCLEGLAAAGPMWARFGDPAKLTAEDLGTKSFGHYLGQLCVSVALFLRPERIVLGGGLLQNPALFTATQLAFGKLMGGYLPSAQIDPAQLLVRAGLGARAGAWGGIVLAQQASRQAN